MTLFLLFRDRKEGVQDESQPRLTGSFAAFMKIVRLLKRRQNEEGDNSCRNTLLRR